MPFIIELLRNDGTDRKVKPRRVGNKLNELQGIRSAAENSRNPIAFPEGLVRDFSERVRLNALGNIYWLFNRLNNSVELTTKLLCDSSPEVRKYATILFGFYFDRFSEKYDLLDLRLQDDEPAVRQAAIEILHRHLEEVPEAKNKGMRMFDDSNPETRSHAIRYLAGTHLFSDGEYLSILKKASLDPDPSVRQVVGMRVSVALAPRIGREEVLGTFKNSKFPEIRAYLSWMLDEDKRNPVLQTYVLDATRDVHPFVRTMALFTLYKRFFLFYKDPRPYLQDCLEDRDEGVRNWARYFSHEISLNYTLNHRRGVFETNLR